MSPGIGDDAAPTEELSLEELLERWIRRLRRSHALYVEHFREEQFEELVAALVTSAFIERALLIGVQLAGYAVNANRNFAFTLEGLVRIAARQGWLSRDLRRLLRRFADIRNNLAHNIDYHLTAEAVASLRALLPADSEAQVQQASANILPAPSTNITAVLVYEQIADLAFRASQNASQRRARQAD
jgi:hypothetical protein